LTLPSQAANTLRVAHQDQKKLEENKTAHEKESSSACPFGFGSEGRNPRAGSSDFKTKLEEKKKEITTLYEEYIHLEMLREVWNHPTTKNPQLEPVFTAAMHSLEISFLLLAEFVTDRRSYVAKRQRIESVAKGIAEQCTLVADLVDADLLMREIEAQTTEISTAETNPVVPKSLSLAQDYPFPDCPPTVRGLKGGGQSPGLARLYGAVADAFASLRPSDRLALQNVIRNITAAFDGAFSRWQVGLGIEEQLNQVREIVGLEPLDGLYKRRDGLYLDYACMVRPDVVLATRTEEHYTHSEDFFFRSIHLATECWSFVALDRLANADLQCQGEHWHEAAAYVRHAGLIIEYLGANVSTLKCMNLRDYLHLKVEIEGTSGEGSSQVKDLKQASQKLLAPLYRAVDAISAGASDSTSLTATSKASATEDTEMMARKIATIYKRPEEHEGLHDFAKALEFLDCSVCGGFYFRHFSLAVSVIGSDSKGTMNRSVKTLKHAYETSLFPSLDRARTLCGTDIDAELGETRKGKIMHDLSERRKEKQRLPDASASDLRLASVDAESSGKAKCGSAMPVVRAIKPDGRLEEPAMSSVERDGDRSVTDALEKARAELYDARKVPAFFASAEDAKLSFLSHSFGRIPPMVHAASLKSLYQLYARPESIWDVAFSTIIPEAQQNVMTLISNQHQSSPDQPTPPSPNSLSHSVEFGHNTHELVLRLMSDAVARDGALHVLCSDTEFYSFNRQMKRLLDFFRSKPSASLGDPVVTAEVVPILPIATFQRRFVQRAKELKGSVNFVYVSQVTYKTQETLIHDLAEFGNEMEEALLGSTEDRNAGSTEGDLPYVLVDGCHSFGALEVNVSRAPPSLFYVSTMVKHAASGANAAFICIHNERVGRLKPLSTGWLADPATLAPLSHGVSLKGEGSVEYQEGCAMAGATPGWLPSLITFNELMRVWRAKGITLHQAHAHVTNLHQRLHSQINDATRTALLSPGSTSSACKPSSSASAVMASHTLSWEACDTERAVWLVGQLRQAGVQVDSRGPFVRMGFGFNHSARDVDHLAAALQHTASSIAQH